MGLVPSLETHGPARYPRVARRRSSPAKYCNWKPHEDGWTKLPSWAMAKRVITTANAMVYFGAELTKNSEFQDAVHDFVEDLLFTAEVLRWTPSIGHNLIAPLLMRNYKASQTTISHLTPVVEQRLRRARKSISGLEPPTSKPVDCVQVFVDANSRKQDWIARRIIQVVRGMWFASVHQPRLRWNTLWRTSASVHTPWIH